MPDEFGTAIAISLSQAPFSNEILRSARLEAAYFCGEEGVGVWTGAGCVFTGCDLMPCKTDAGPLRLLAYTASVIEVTMKATADQVVALERALAAPRGPNAVWLPWPPNAAEMSPAFPLCSSTTMMMKKQTKMWMVTMNP